MITWFMETLPGVKQLIVCNDNSTIAGFLISQLIASYWALKESY